MTNAERQAKYLSTHSEFVNEKRRLRYESLVEERKCPRCGKSVKARINKGRKLCISCLQKAKEYRDNRK
ncbi:MAG: hypothetical protein LBI67_06045 [Treponema sp.]|jgi:predicted PP-loop superfamily ATPase|nr:hypothetical protein [Treponema sp.]